MTDICGAVEDVVALAGAGCPVMAAPMAAALDEPDLDFFFPPFFFSCFTISVCVDMSAVCEMDVPLANPTLV